MFLMIHLGMEPPESGGGGIRTCGSHETLHLQAKKRKVKESNPQVLPWHGFQVRFATNDATFLVCPGLCLNFDMKKLGCGNLDKATPNFRAYCF